MTIPSVGPGAHAAVIQSAVCACLKRILPRRLSKQPMQPTTHLFRDLNLDSMQILELIALLESVVGRPITERELKVQTIETVTDVSNFVAGLLAPA